MTGANQWFNPSLTPAEIYHQLTEGAGARGLQEAQLQLQLENREENDRSGLIASIGDLIATGWEGSAGAAAQGAALPMRERVMSNHDLLDQAQDLMSRQIGSFQRAHDNVRPISNPPDQSLDEALPFEVDYEKAVTGYQADAQHNIDVFGQYDGASQYNETNMPQRFHIGGQDAGSVSVKSADTIEVGDSSPRDGEPRDGGPGPGGDPGPGGGPGPAGGPEAGPGQVAGPSNPGGYPGSSGAGFPGSGESTGSSSAGGFQTSPEGYRPGGTDGYSSSVPGQGLPAAATGGGPVSGGFPVSGGVSGGPGAGSGGFGGAGAAGPRGGAAGPLVRGPGVGVGALAAEEAVVRRGAANAAAGRGAGPMGAPMGAGRGKGDDDTEHERKVLIEADAEGTFGSDELTAPQVIGDDEYED